MLGHHLCLKIRTGFAEDPRCDPARDGAGMYAADLRYHRLPECTERKGSSDGPSSFRRSGTRKAKLKWPSGRQFSLSDALSCLSIVRDGLKLRSASSGRGLLPQALLFTDAPSLQALLVEGHTGEPAGPSEGGGAQQRAPGLLAIPGWGIDPTNEYRRQNATPLNLQKVAADFYLQGACACSLVLMPSAFYDAGASRGAHGAFTGGAARPKVSCTTLREQTSCPWRQG